AGPGVQSRNLGPSSAAVCENLPFFAQQRTVCAPPWRQHAGANLSSIGYWADSQIIGANPPTALAVPFRLLYSSHLAPAVGAACRVQESACYGMARPAAFLRFARPRPGHPPHQP